MKLFHSVWSLFPFIFPLPIYPSPSSSLSFSVLVIIIIVVNKTLRLLDSIVTARQKQHNNGELNFAENKLLFAQKILCQLFFCLLSDNLNANQTIAVNERVRELRFGEVKLKWHTRMANRAQTGQIWNILQFSWMKIICLKLSTQPAFFLCDNNVNRLWSFSQGSLGALLAHWIENLKFLSKGRARGEEKKVGDGKNCAIFRFHLSLLMWIRRVEGFSRTTSGKFSFNFISMACFV